MKKNCLRPKNYYCFLNKNINSCKKKIFFNINLDEINKLDHVLVTLTIYFEKFKRFSIKF